MTASIVNFPQEILVEIFSRYIESEGNMSFSRNVAPVCKAWWNASSTPSLWETVHVRNWSYARSLGERGLLQHTRSLRVSVNGESPYYRRSLLDPVHLSALVSSISDLRSLEISQNSIDENAMMIVAGHCRNLERLRMEKIGRGENGPITIQVLGQFLNICGPKLKHLSFVRCDVADSEHLFAEVAARCSSLEVFELCNEFFFLQCIDNSEFPINKFVSGCSRLRKLELSDCEVIETDHNNCFGFRDLKVFKAKRCYTHRLDVCSLLKNSAELEHLELDLVDDSVSSTILNIQSNKMKFLSVQINSEDVNLDTLKQAVGKWKHSLLCLRISRWECGKSCDDITSVLRLYIDDNPCPKLEVLSIEKVSVDLSFLETFIRKCQNLKQLTILMTKLGKKSRHFINREQVIKFADSK